MKKFLRNATATLMFTLGAIVSVPAMATWVSICLGSTCAHCNDSGFCVICGGDGSCSIMER